MSYTDHLDAELKKFWETQFVGKGESFQEILESFDAEENLGENYGYELDETYHVFIDSKEARVGLGEIYEWIITNEKHKILGKVDLEYMLYTIGIDYTNLISSDPPRGRFLNISKEKMIQWMMCLIGAIEGFQFSSMEHIYACAMLRHRENPLLKILSSSEQFTKFKVFFSDSEEKKTTRDVYGRLIKMFPEAFITKDNLFSKTLFKILCESLQGKDERMKWISKYTSVPLLQKQKQKQKQEQKQEQTQSLDTKEDDQEVFLTCGSSKFRIGVKTKSFGDFMILSEGDTEIRFGSVFELKTKEMEAVLKMLSIILDNEESDDFFYKDGEVMFDYFGDDIREMSFHQILELIHILSTKFPHRKISHLDSAIAEKIKDTDNISQEIINVCKTLVIHHDFPSFASALCAKL